MKKLTLCLIFFSSVTLSCALHANTAAEEKQCADLGLKKGTPKFGECVLQMMNRNESLRKDEEAKRKDEEARQRDEAAKLRDREMLREQQQRAEEASAERERNLELRKQKIEEARQKWTNRCGFEKQKAYNQYIQEHNYDCQASRGGMKSLCEIGVLSNAKNFSDSAFDSCMSQFPF